MNTGMQDMITGWEKQALLEAAWDKLTGLMQHDVCIDTDSIAGWFDVIHKKT